MGLFAGFFSSKAPEKSSGKQDTFVLAGSSNYERQISGEQHYQGALESICGRHQPSGVHRFETAWLVPEASNPRDKNAVRVEIRGKQVGYLSPKHALLFRQQLSGRGMPNARGQCQAVITGGWISSDGRKGLYEVSLDLPGSYE